MATNNVVLSSATSAEDIRACQDMRVEVFVIEQGVPKHLELEYEEESEHFMAHLDGQLVGTGRLRPTGVYIKLERIATLKQFRGRGIGSTIVRALAQHAQQHHPELLPSMGAQTHALSFYRKLGWQQYGDEFIEDGISHIPHYMMVLPPDSAEDVAQLDAAKAPEALPPDVRRMLQL